MSTKRCTECGICPLPEDVEFYWGQEEPTSPLCLMCRHRQKLRTTTYKIDGDKVVPIEPRDTKLLSVRPKQSAIVVMVQKLYEMPPHLLQEWFVPQAAREALRLRNYGSDCFVTDGERIWGWSSFPYNRDKAMDWDRFLQIYNEWDLYEPTRNGISKVQDEESYTQFEHVKT